MKDFNKQIINYWKNSSTLNENRIKGFSKSIILESMKFLKFGYPVHTNEELLEVLKICNLYYDLSFNPNFITNQFKKNAKLFNIAISITNRCGNRCVHCSTKASLNENCISTPFEDFKTVICEMLPHTNLLYISCEGDPFYYQDYDKNIVDIMNLLLKSGFNKISLQSMAPNQEKFILLEQILNSIKNYKDESFFFLPQVSFNLYSPRSGIKLRNKTDSDGSNFKECFFPSININKYSKLVSQVINNHLKQTKFNIEKYSSEIIQSLQYLKDFISTILAYASQGFPIHFELRGDNYSEFTKLDTIQHIFELIINILNENLSQLNLIHGVDSAYIVPLGRATKLFPDGKRKEQTLFEKHIQMNSISYLCENWMYWNSMTIDTFGYPQLCYSNMALTPEARTKYGPNLYKDGFEAICDFYINVMEDRISLLKDNLPKLVRIRPNNYYCPLNLFKQTLQKFNLKK